MRQGFLRRPCRFIDDRTIVTLYCRNSRCGHAASSIQQSCATSLCAVTANTAANRLDQAVRHIGTLVSTVRRGRSRPLCGPTRQGGAP
jgi:hypothetical protein